MPERCATARRPMTDSRTSFVLGSQPSDQSFSEEKEAEMKFKVVLSPEPVGGYSVSVPALPGCHSQGDTRAEALANIREAADLWLEVTEAASLRDQLLINEDNDR